MDHDQDRLQSLNSGSGQRRLKSGGRGYSVFVRFTKLVLPAAALIIVIIVGIRLSAGPQNSLIADLPTEMKTTAGQIEIAGARYEGVDSQNRPYVVEAATAARDPADEKNVLMTGTHAEISASDKNKIDISANEGRYHTETGKLFLTTDVTLTQDGGYHLYLQDLNIDTKMRAADSDKPLTGEGPIGTLKASGVSVMEQGNLITFTGPATLTLTIKNKGQEG